MWSANGGGGEGERKRGSRGSNLGVGWGNQQFIWFDIVNEKTDIYFYIVFHILMQTSCA